MRGRAHAEAEFPVKITYPRDFLWLLRLGRATQ